MHAKRPEDDQRGSVVSAYIFRPTYTVLCASTLASPYACQSGGTHSPKMLAFTVAATFLLCWNLTNGFVLPAGARTGFGDGMGFRMSLSDADDCGGLTRGEMIKNVRKFGAVTAAGAGCVLTRSGSGSEVPRTPAAFAASSDLPEEAYTTIGGDMKTCRILNGMWQLSGAHGFRPDQKPALQAMAKLVNKGYTTFDLADHYGPAEDFVGAFESQNRAEADKGQFFTKWVPRPTRMDRSTVEAGVGQSLARMKTEPIDLMQFHWWSYDVPFYLDALGHLQELKGDGKIRHLGLTNFDTKHLEIITDRGIKIASNQVQYSLLDQRPGQRMATLAAERGVGLLCYGTVLGGLLSEKWIGKPTPTRSDFTTVSEMKYYNMIRQWGGWPLFQELLSVTKSVADKHGVSIPNVGVRWVLDRPAVAGAIVGTRLGLTDHSDDNRRVFGLKLDDEDRSRIAAVTEQSRDLMTVIGDVGDEYRG